MSSRLASLDAEIREAEAKASAALSSQLAMGRYTASDAEARAVANTVKRLDKRVSDLRARRFEVISGVEPPPAAPPPRAVDAEAVRKLKILDKRMASHVAQATAEMDA